MPATLVALTNTKELLTFDSARPGVILNTVRITGLIAPSEPLLGIDYRPATGQLYTATQRFLYKVDPATGVATRFATFNPSLTNVAAAGFDFNPVPDLLRVASATRRNLRADPDTGAVAVDTSLSYLPGQAPPGRLPSLAGSAYENPDNDPATGTRLFGIDYVRDTLVLQNPANSGTLTTVGSLGVNTSPFVGFDIGPGNAAFLSAGNATNTQSGLYTVNLTTGAATLVGNIGTGQLINGLAVVPPARPVYAVTSTNLLVTFNAAAPEIINWSRPITGLLAGENVTGIDFRPSTGELYATSSAQRVYVINIATGAATRVNGAGYTGGQFGVDFNPVADALRVVSDAEQNLRLAGGGRGVVNADTALTYAAGDLNAGANPNVVGSAYTNNFPGATGTTLFGIDSGTDDLVRQGGPDGTPSPNGGELTTVGTGLGVNVSDTDFVGFDISAGGTAYAALRLQGQTESRFYTINTTTGLATPVIGVRASNDPTPPSSRGVIGFIRGNSPAIVAIAVAPPFVRFQTVAQSVSEAATSVRVVVTRTGDTTATAAPNGGALTVTYTLLGETASAGADFTQATGPVTFAPGDTFATFEVTLVPDDDDEPNESLAILLSKAPADAFTIDPMAAQATLTILDDDLPSPPA